MTLTMIITAVALGMTTMINGVNSKLECKMIQMMRKLRRLMKRKRRRRITKVDTKYSLLNLSLSIESLEKTWLK